MHALVEKTDDGPALGHVADLGQGAEVAKEAFGGFPAVETEDCVEQGAGVVGFPVVSHGVGGSQSQAQDARPAIAAPSRRNARLVARPRRNAQLVVVTL
jgi:hypothetical protein